MYIFCDIVPVGVESTQNVTFKEHTSNICAVEIKNLHYWLLEQKFKYTQLILDVGC